MPSAMRDVDCVAFLQWALPRMRMRWRGLRKVRRQVCRRIRRRMEELGLDSAEGYRRHLERHPGEWRTLAPLCRVTISRFYRDRAVFEALTHLALPDLARAAALAGRDALRCWSAGCASGEEPFSVSLAWALSAARAFPDLALRVVATDIDEALLARARVACYPRGALRELPPAWVDTAFRPAGNELCLEPELRRGVDFLHQDIRREMPAGPFDLVLCRNLVFTYFESSLQAELLDRMLLRLRPAGLLVLGSHESPPPGDWPLERAYGPLPVYRQIEPSPSPKTRPVGAFRPSP